MLILSSILSVLLLLIANSFARRSRRTGGTVVYASLAVMAVPVVFLFMGFFLTTVAIQAFLLCGAFIVWLAARRGPGFFLALSCGATVVAYAFTGAMVLNSEREYARLRVRYPYESMEGRLPTPQSAPDDVPLLPAAAERLSRFGGGFRMHENGFRNFQLELLHEHAVALFINSPGFGVSRMLRPTERGLDVNRRREPVPLQPGARFTSMWSPGEQNRLSARAEVQLSRMLEDSIVDFVNPQGFGYVKDRRHVAGFETHRFSQVPAPANDLKIQTLELVSLLLHDEPEVYESSHLPRMDQVHDMRTRPLDRFESFALGSLRQGEDLYTTQSAEGVRLLGAIRSVEQCVACHGGERGALLGAFSYTLRAVEPPERSPSVPTPIGSGRKGDREVVR
jgi:hypothetical protein